MGGFIFEEFTSQLVVVGCAVSGGVILEDGLFLEGSFGECCVLAYFGVEHLTWIEVSHGSGGLLVD